MTQSVKGVFLLLMLILLPHRGTAQQPNTTGSQLDRYLQEAAQNNPELESRFYEYLAVLEQVPQVNTLPDPELAFGYFISPIETRVGPQDARIGITQMLPWFGTLGARSDAATQMAKARFQAFQENRNQLFYEIKKNWYMLYENAEAIRILQENIDILTTFESLATRRYEGAQVSQVDVLRVQIEKEDLLTRMELLKDARNVLLQELRELLNRPEEEPLIVKSDTLMTETLKMSASELQKAVLNRNPRLTRLEYEAASAHRSVEAARKDGLPKFGLGIDYIITGERTDMASPDNGHDAIMARAGIQIPLYRKKYRAKEQQAKLQLRSVREEQSAARNRLITRLEQALKDYNDAQRRITLYRDKQIQRTRQAIDILVQQYSSAGTDFEELLRLQRRLLEYQLSGKQAVVDQNTALAFIEYLYGKYNVNPEETEFETNDN